MLPELTEEEIAWSILTGQVCCAGLTHDNREIRCWYGKDSFTLHRHGGPAIEYGNGDRFWFVNGKSHREDGPAIEYANGCRGWALNDKFMPEKEYWLSLEKIREQNGTS